MAPSFMPDLHLGTQTDIPPFEHEKKFKWTGTQNPSFTYGQKVSETETGRAWLEGEKAGWKVIDTDTEDPRALYKLMLSGIVPRPVGFVSSVSADGIENLAPFSWFNMVCPAPPLVYISVGKVTRIKDTAANIRATKDFTVSIISEPWVDNANITCIDTPEEVGEWPMSGLTKVKSESVKAPRVQESAFSMECELYQATDIHDPKTGELTVTMFLGLVKKIHIRKDTLTARGTVDPSVLKPISRMGDITYARTGDGFRIGRPFWEEEAEKIQSALAEHEKNAQASGSA